MSQQQGDQYVKGYEAGFRDGLVAGYEKDESETWDRAYTAGYRAAQEEESDGWWTR